MERTISQEERIKRAEEIYQRRKMQNGVRVSTRNVNTNNKPEYALLKKLILQIAICLILYFIFYLIQNSNYIFSEDVISRTKEFLSYDINFGEVFNNIGNFYNENIAGFFKDNEKTEEATKESVEENTIEDNNEENQNEDTDEQDGIGGGEEGENLLENEQVAEITEEVSSDEEVPLTQMEIDANYIKENYSLIVPLNGTISSRFGPRTPTEIVSANHAGIDIAANEGTVFVASMEGTVTDVIYEGGYGNHVYIQNNDVITLYAHCKTIYVNVGDIVAQGQSIGEVGQTGNATGPHLHFELRRGDRLINPEYVLQF